MKCTSFLFISVTSVVNVFFHEEFMSEILLLQEIQKEQQSRREAQVVMYRSYRIGELPDIEISNSALIAPIQALAMVYV